MTSDAFEARLGHRFSDAALLKVALTHKSAGAPHNERLEFLGDAVLGYVIGHVLFTEKPGDREDGLTLMRASLVRRECLAEIASELDLGALVRLGPAAASSGGHRRASILADTLEAVIGAVHEDGGLEAARHVIERLWRPRLEEVSTEELKDPKTLLQEWLQGRGLPLPEYTVARTEGAEHKKLYEVHCRVANQEDYSVGIDASRKSAEKAAARAMLERIS